MHRGRLLAAGSLPELRGSIGAEVRIAVTVQPCTTAQVLAKLPSTVRCVASSDRTLALEMAAEAKMDALRALAQCGDRVEDVAIAAPGLQELYARLTAEAGTRQ
jgi:hypothetical protein